MDDPSPLLLVAGPTASGKSARAVALAKELDGEVISVDSRQVYRMLDIGTEKTTPEEMQDVPHHLIDICDPKDTYSAGDFVRDAERVIADIRSRGKRPILAGGTHFYFEALLYGLPADIPQNPLLRKELEKRSVESLMDEVRVRDPRRAARLDPHNKRRIMRALEIIDAHGHVPERAPKELRHEVSWIILNPDRDELRERIERRLEKALTSGLIEETRRVREYVGDMRLNELGLEYRIVGEFLRGERSEESLLPSLTTKVWHYARHQKAWLRRLEGISS